MAIDDEPICDFDGDDMLAEEDDTRDDAPCPICGDIGCNGECLDDEEDDDEDGSDGEDACPECDSEYCFDLGCLDDEEGEDEFDE
jgi:hypothetical protein